MRARHRAIGPKSTTVRSERDQAGAVLPRLSSWRVKSILVPTDFSAVANQALKYALELARPFNAQITVLHVIEPMPTADFGAYPLALPQDQLQKKIKQTLDDFSQREVTEEFLKGTKISVGTPFQEITEAARNLKVDLIVIGTHGRTGLKHAILGSTAERVVRHAPCPVLTVCGKETKNIKT